MFAWQKLVELIVTKENTLFTGQRSHAFYEAMLSSEESISRVARRHKPDNVEKSHASSALLLYRLLDVLVFANGDEWISSTVRRQIFPVLTIPVRTSISVLVNRYMWTGLESVLQ